MKLSHSLPRDAVVGADISTHGVEFFLRYIGLFPQHNSASNPGQHLSKDELDTHEASRRKNSRSLLENDEEVKEAEKFSLGSDNNSNSGKDKDQKKEEKKFYNE